MVRAAFFIAIAAFSIPARAQEQQDKAQSKLYQEQADLIMAETKAMNDARDLMVLAANYDTTNIRANFDAGLMHLRTIGKDQASRYFLRIYRQKPEYRFDLEYWIGMSFQYGMDFNRSQQFYERYRARLQSKPNYQGRDVVALEEVERRLEEVENGKAFMAQPKKFQVVNVGREINSEWDDYAPLVNAEENELVFTSRRRDGNMNEDVANDNIPFEDIFTSTRKNEQWTRAKNIGAVVNTRFSESDLALSPDGKTLFIYRDDGNGDIYQSNRKADGTWDAPAPMPGVINSQYRESSVSITRDGNVLYFASERPGGLGGSDIYVCVKDKTGAWGQPRNLGPSINTQYDEDGPYIDYDMKTLYFSSKGRKSMGGYDVFKATLADPQKWHFSEPENLGYPINTPDDDVFFVGTKDGKRAYFASVRDDGMGYLDIYTIVMEEAPAPKKEEKPPVAKQPKLIRYQVNVVDENNKPADARVKFSRWGDNTLVAGNSAGTGTWEFQIKIETSHEYRLSVEKDGYMFQNIPVNLDPAFDSERTVTRVVQLKRLVVGSVSILRNIYFDFDRATLRQESYNELNKLESMMKQNPGMKVELGGHTDAVGSKAFNLSLSKRRAEAVKTFLTSKGIDPRRVTVVGYGKSRPLASNDDEKEGRELNRRVEFKVLSKGGN